MRCDAITYTANLCCAGKAETGDNSGVHSAGCSLSEEWKPQAILLKQALT